MFESQKLPTLGTYIWWHWDKFQDMFYEKPTVPNTVLQADTALSIECVRATLVQEVVRSLNCCSSGVDLNVRQEILSVFAQKLRKSGFSLVSTQILFVHGVTKFLDLERLAKLPKSGPKFRPMFREKSDGRLERKLAKYEEKTGWYSVDKNASNKVIWRSEIQAE